MGIHYCDIPLVPKKLQRRLDLAWWVYYPDELAAPGFGAGVESFAGPLHTLTGNQSWPSVWATHTVNQMRYKIAVNRTPRRHYTLLARKPRPHRSEILSRLWHSGSLDRNYYSWLEDDSLQFDHTTCDVPHNQLDGACTDEAQMWSPPAGAFADSAISVVLESNEDQLFITEKTFIPLYQGRMPLIYGAPGLYNTLLGWGFEFPREVNLEPLLAAHNHNYSHAQRRAAFVDELHRLTEQYSPEDLVEMYAPHAAHNIQTLIALAQQIPDSYYQWRSTVQVRWAETARLFIEQIEGTPWIKI